MKKILSLCSILFLLCACGNPKPRLHIYSWADFFSMELIEQFEKENNCQIILDTFDSNESMYAKLKLGSSGYDLIVPSNYFLELMHKQQMIEPVDFTLVPNFQYFDRRIFKLLSPHMVQYGVPYMLTYSGIAWRRDKLGAIDPSWSIFGSKEYKGRMTMLNDLREALGAALRYLGYSVNTIDLNHLQEAKQLLISWKRQLAKFESEQYKNGIASGEYLVVQGYNGDILQVMEENKNVDFTIPSEGMGVSIDFLVIPKGAANRELAHRFMNFLYNPENAAKNMDFTCFLCPNVAAYGKIKELLKLNLLPFLKEEAV
ncbi:MAG: spermidine/putrescine ABC transporter substrate-binding protein, partial [Verrucomicrobia bacterium]|nr:spermidine/putrescine ABC transporter substrate-binding protein [Verrucomicrobiota bacterium]